MDKSIFQLLNEKVLRRFAIVRAYQGSDTKSAATIEHIASGFVYTVAIAKLGDFLSPWLYLLVLPVWVLYAPFKEFVLDKNKNHGKPLGDAVAQVIERTSGFLVGLLWMI